MPVCPKCKSKLVMGAVRCRLCGNVIFDPGSVIATTTDSIEGYEIYEYYGYVHAVAIQPTVIMPPGVNEMTPMCAAIEDFKDQCFLRLQESVQKEGGNAVIGVKTTISEYGDHGFMLSLDGTAVYALPKDLAPYLAENYYNEHQAEMTRAQNQKETAELYLNSEGSSEENKLGQMIVKFLLAHPDGESAVNISKALPKSISPQEATSCIKELLDTGVLVKNEFGALSVNENYKK